jgi:hypothetical protein
MAAAPSSRERRFNTTCSGGTCRSVTPQPRRRPMYWPSPSAFRPYTRPIYRAITGSSHTTLPD